MVSFAGDDDDMVSLVERENNAEKKMTKEANPAATRNITMMLRPRQILEKVAQVRELKASFSVFRVLDCMKKEY